MDPQFEDFLKDVHAEQYIGVDDDMPDDFDAWLGDLSANELNQYARQFKERNY